MKISQPWLCWVTHVLSNQKRPSVFAGEVGAASDLTCPASRESEAEEGEGGGEEARRRGKGPPQPNRYTAAATTTGGPTAVQ